MNLIFHHALKDLRAQRWLVAGWAAALLAICVIEGLKLDVHIMGPGTSGQGSNSPVYALMALGATRVVLGWLLAVRIVHTDPLDGTDAFWLTRPLSPRMLFAAKLGLIGTLLVLVPAIGALVVFTLNGVPAFALPGAVAGWIVSDMLVLMVMTLLACITRDLARIVLALMTGLAAWAMLQVAAPRLQLAIVFGELPNAGVMRVALFLFAAAIVAGCVALIRRQYLTRRTMQTAIAGAAVALVLVATGSVLWAWLRPYDSRRRDTPVDRPWSGAPGVSLGVPLDSLQVRSYFTQTGPTTRAIRDWVSANLVIEGAGEGRVIDVVSGKGAWHLPNTGEAVEAKDITFESGVPYNRMSLRVIEQTVGVVLFLPSTWPRNLRLLDLPSGKYEQWQGTSGVYEADFVLQAYQASIAAVIPLRPGASGSVASQETTLVAVSANQKQWALDIRESMPRGLFPTEIPRTAYLLRNRKRGEAVFIGRGGIPLMTGGGTASSYLTVTRSMLTDRWMTKTKAGALDPSWFEDAELVLVGFVREGGAFAKHVTIPNVTLPKVDGKGQ